MFFNDTPLHDLSTAITLAVNNFIELEMQDKADLPLIRQSYSYISFANSLTSREEFQIKFNFEVLHD